MNIIEVPIDKCDYPDHREHLRQCFEQHIFRDREIQELMESVVTAYLSELEGNENILLVEIQADLGEQDLPALPALRALAAPSNGEGFRSAYRKMVDQVVPVIGRDLKVTAGREAVVWVGSDIATAVTVRIGSAVAVGPSRQWGDRNCRRWYHC